MISNYICSISTKLHIIIIDACILSIETVTIWYPFVTNYGHKFLRVVGFFPAFWMFEVFPQSFWIVSFCVWPCCIIYVIIQYYIHHHVHVFLWFFKALVQFMRIPLNSPLWSGFWGILNTVNAVLEFIVGWIAWKCAGA